MDRELRKRMEEICGDCEDSCERELLSMADLYDLIEWDEIPDDGLDSDREPNKMGIKEDFDDSAIILDLYMRTAEQQLHTAIPWPKRGREQRFVEFCRRRIHRVNHESKKKLQEMFSELSKVALPDEYYKD